MAHRHPQVLRDRKLEKLTLASECGGRLTEGRLAGTLLWLPGRAPAIMPMANDLLAARGGFEVRPARLLDRHVDS